VKSRIAAVLGDDAALDLYRAFVLDLLDTLDRSGRAVCICVHPPDALGVVAGWLGRKRCYQPQDGADLGGRMEEAFRRAFARGASRALLIGSDLPDLPAGLLDDALRSLDRHDAVIGPATDGGYYLIGFRRETFLPGVFAAMPWSTGKVLARTMEAFRTAGLAVRRLPAWRDNDTVEDLRDLVRRSRASAFAKSRTMVYLADRREIVQPPEDRDAQV
jgi:hypothetical protein